MSFCTLVALFFTFYIVQVIAQSTAEIQLFSVWKKKRPPYWNFSSGCYFDGQPYHSNRRAIPHRANKFRPNLATRGGVMTSYTISRWRQRWFSTTSGFVYNDITLIRRSKSIRKPNFIDISQFTAETQLLPVWIRYDFSAILECFFRLRLRP